MSGFTAIYQHSPEPPLESALAGMSNALNHRGPDGITSWCSERVGFGHCKMETTPESVHESLPFAHQPSGLTITADARIDNRADLAAELGLRGEISATMADSQFILKAYQKWGFGCVTHLVGDFAFLIWDQPRQLLFAARDQMGIKPFYYHHAGQLFAAASEVSAVRAHPRIPPQFNEGRIADYLVDVLEGINKTSTFFQHIFRLPPAHRLILRGGHLSIEQYWQPDAHTELHLADDGAYQEAFKEAFSTALGAQLRCNGQATAMLSGGVDSSTIVATARELLQQQGRPNLQVYSGISEAGENCQETRAIQEVIAAGGLHPNSIKPSQIHVFSEHLEELFQQLQEPFDSTMTIIQVLYLMARSQGHRVMLDGVEGDLVHSLSNCYPAFLLRQGHLRSGLQEARLLHRNYYNGQISPLSLARRTLVPAIIPNWLRHLRGQLMSRRLLANDLHGSPINSDFARRIKVGQRLEEYRANSGRALAGSLREDHIRCVTHPLLTAGLERYDRVAAGCGMEARHPLLDRRLVEFMISLPWNQKVRNGWSKYQLRCLADKQLPASVAWRNSWLDLGWNFTQQRATSLAGIPQSTCKKMTPWLIQYVDKNTLERAMKTAAGYNSGEDSDILWKIYSLATWSSGLA